MFSLTTTFKVMARIERITFTETTLVAHLKSGQMVECPLALFPRLAKATPAERVNFTLSSNGLGAHWPLLDEDLSAEGFVHYASKALSH
jgi:hypothetical protein